MDEEIAAQRQKAFAKRKDDEAIEAELAAQHGSGLWEKRRGIFK